MKKEGEGEDREGALAAAGFAVVLVLVGLPVWWYTTTVYRATLPYATIEQLSHQLRHHTVGLDVVGQVRASFKDDLETKLESMQSVKFLLTHRLPTREEQTLLKSTHQSLSDLDLNLSNKIHVANGNLAVVVMEEGNNNNIMDNSSVIVGRQRIIFVTPNADLGVLASVVRGMVMDVLASKRAHVARPLHQLPGQHKQEAMRQVPTEPGYDVTLTLMVPEPHRTKVNWDAKAAVDEYLGPVVRQLESVAVVSVRSQVLYMTGLSVTPEWSPHHQHYALPHHQLPLTINAIEAKLGSFVWTRPSLHFVVYVPRENQMPLVIHSPDGTPLTTNSFLVPRWGGVMIHNVPPVDNTNTTTTAAMSPRYLTLDSHWVMSTVITHLHHLLPIPTLKETPEVKLLAPTSPYQLTEWQVDALARARVSAYLANIRTTLQSLCELVGEISNMVISDEVGGWVWGAVEEWGECGHAAREGRLQEATLYCTRSFTQADAAFFHPSMLALLYFPDNQKYAIYVPLFLPVSIPVLLSLKMVFSLFKKGLKSKVKED
ncbi:hypothetical protein Pcinc_015164 [Petrolisthes cinctipes]|uniref:GPI transamidase component PIG-S n=1 Tax=Petrolisthes cinctipes TaxID=88211 RepID=A0AAE1FVK5_PETCI|nr:hypothetical protein Pcinc_015164 [Petrolisthes cinctipes]